MKPNTVVRQMRRGRGVETRMALLAAGQKLLAERPIDALAIDEIVQTAGVAKGSFYNHFEDKDAFAFAIFHAAGHQNRRRDVPPARRQRQDHATDRGTPREHRRDLTAAQPGVKQ